MTDEKPKEVTASPIAVPPVKNPGGIRKERGKPPTITYEGVRGPGVKYETRIIEPRK